MKNLSLVLNGVLAIAVIILYVLHFSSAPNNEVVAEKSLTEDSTEVDEPTPAPQLISLDSLPSTSNLSIAYINIDELNAGYKLIADLNKKSQAEIDAKSKKLQREKQTLQQDYQLFIENVQGGAITSREEAQQRELRFQERNQELMKKEYALEQEFQNKAQKNLKKIKDKVSNYLTTYGKEFNYSFVLATGTASSVLYSNDSLDITKPILEGLNAEYKAKK